MKKCDYAFLVHARSFEDYYLKFPLLRFFPRFLLERIMIILPPIKIGSISLLDQKKNEVKGEIFAVLLTAKQMLEKRERSRKKIIKALDKIKRRKIKYVGLGALTSSITNGGEDLVGLFPDIYITSGNTLTSAITIQDLREIVKDDNFSIAVVGATGSIGQIVSKLVVKEELTKNLMIIGRTPENLKKLKEDLHRNNQNIKIVSSLKINDVSNSDIVVIATSSSDILLHESHLKKNTVIYDVTQPKNSNIKIKNRPDVQFIDGGLVRVSKNVKLNFNFGLPKGVIFSCLAETMLLALEKHEGNFSLKKLDQENVYKIEKIYAKYGFKSFMNKD